MCIHILWYSKKCAYIYIEINIHYIYAYIINRSKKTQAQDQALVRVFVNLDQKRRPVEWKSALQCWSYVSSIKLLPSLSFQLSNLWLARFYLRDQYKVSMSPGDSCKNPNLAATRFSTGQGLVVHGLVTPWWKSLWNLLLSPTHLPTI